MSIKGAEETQLSNFAVNSNGSTLVKKTEITVYLEGRLHAGWEPGLELSKAWDTVFTGSPAQPQH